MLMFKDSTISILLTFNILVLSTIINDNSNASYNVEPSTFWVFNISCEVAFSLKLPLTSTALIKTRLSIPASKID